jgi:hypothetical protein
MRNDFEMVCLASGNISKNYSEDRVGHRENVFWVIDGATSINDERLYTGYATDAEAFSAHLSEGLFLHAVENISLQELLGLAMEHSVGKSEILRSDRKFSGHDMPSASVVIIRANGDTVDYLSLGDSEIYYPEVGLFSESRVHKILDSTTLEKIHARMAASSVEVFSREFGLDLIQKARDRMNSPDGYWVATPRGEGLPFAEFGTVPNRGGSIYLWSDGFGCLFESYGYSKDILRKKNIRELSGIVRKIENDDPGLKDHWRFK